VNSMEEAVACVRSIGSKAIEGMFDFHNATSESEPWHELARKHYAHIGHIHINEIDGRAPGTGNSDYRPTYDVLFEKCYDKWISIEIFEIPEDPASTLGASMKLFETLERR
ncbi:MAG: sugar phosphate isomerase/epimerase family protein, partial [Spirochaetales bacterium]